MVHRRYSFYSAKPQVKGIELVNGGYVEDSFAFKGRDLLVVPDTSVVRFTVLESKDTDDANLDQQPTADENAASAVAVVPCLLQNKRIVAAVPDLGGKKADVLVELFVDGIGVLDQSATYALPGWAYLGRKPTAAEDSAEGAGDEAEEAGAEAS